MHFFQTKLWHWLLLALHIFIWTNTFVAKSSEFIHAVYQVDKNIFWSTNKSDNRFPCHNKTIQIVVLDRSVRTSRFCLFSALKASWHCKFRRFAQSQKTLKIYFALKRKFLENLHHPSQLTVYWTLMNIHLLQTLYCGTQKINFWGCYQDGIIRCQH